MSVRRLAEAAVQPPSFAFSADNVAWAEKAIARYPQGREHSAVIPLLMRAQEQEGWVTKAAIEHVADMIGMPYIRALEVATFYTQFQLHPVGTRAHVQVCGTTPCMLRGAGDLIETCKKKIHPEPFHTNRDGTLSWEEVECQGACVNAPMVMIFKDTYEDLTPARLEEIIDAFEAGRGAEITPGPQIDRIYSAPATGLTSLTDENAVARTADEQPEPKRRRAAGGGATVPPSRAAKPDTTARETDPTLRTPSPVKVAPGLEAAAEVAPPINGDAADRAAPEAEQVARRRKHADKRTEGDASLRSPEIQADEPVGAGGKHRPEEKAAKPGKPSPEGTRAARKTGKIEPARQPNGDDEGGAA